MEDTYLWARMIMNGVICANIDEPLIYAKIGHDMYERRGGWQYFKKYKEGKRMVLKTGFISTWDYYYTLIVQLIVAVLPSELRGWIYKKKLHSQA